MLQIRHLGKSYKVYASQRARLWELVTGRSRHEEFWALRDVDLHVGQGESLGVIGDNGAGKSTLLKLIAGTLNPTTGSVRLRGRLTAILELGTGFHPEFTGRENLFFAASLMGIDREELAGYYRAIVDFSELEAVIDRPVKTYSTGMVVRLAFSLVTAVRPEILIIDEALAVGDRAFQRKCIARMMDIQRAGTAILFCSHNMHQVVQFCQRVAWLEHGQVKALGEAGEIVDRYVAQDLSAAQDRHTQRRSRAPIEARRCIVEAVSSSPAGPYIRRGDSLSVTIDFKVLQPGEFAFGLAIDRKGSDVRLVAETSQENGLPPVFLEPGSYRFQLRLYTDLLRDGSYQVYAGLMDRSLMQIEDYRAFDLEVADPQGTRSPAVVRARVDWDTEGAFFS